MRKLKLPDRHPERPRLDETDIELIREKGIDGMKEQAERMVRKTLGRQREAPSSGNPVYKAMHACNCESRNRLELAHKISSDGDLSEGEIEAVVNLLIRWIAREYNFYLEQVETQESLKRFSR